MESATGEHALGLAIGSCDGVGERGEADKLECWKDEASASEELSRLQREAEELTEVDSRLR